MLLRELLYELAVAREPVFAGRIVSSDRSGTFSYFF